MAIIQTPAGLGEGKGLARGSLEPGLTDRLAAQVRAYIPSHLWGILVQSKGDLRLYGIPHGADPAHNAGSLSVLRLPEPDEVRKIMARLEGTLPIFRPDQKRFEAQNGLLEPHGVGFTTTGGWWVVQR